MIQPATTLTLLSVGGVLLSDYLHFVGPFSSITARHFHYQPYTLEFALWKSIHTSGGSELKRPYYKLCMVTTAHNVTNNFKTSSLSNVERAPPPEYYRTNLKLWCVFFITLLLLAILLNHCWVRFQLTIIVITLFWYGYYSLTSALHQPLSP